jgi:hypothetical protein
MPKVSLVLTAQSPTPPDFISHLPYGAGDSAQIGKGDQGLFVLGERQGRTVVQTGASPECTGDGAILFGYAFQADDTGRMLPQSVYFSDYPLAPANAPIISQNYTAFSATQPVASLWEEVAGLDPKTLAACQLFDPPAPAAQPR